MGPLGSGCVEKYVEYGSVGCDCVLRRIIGVGGDIVGVVLVVEERRAGVGGGAIYLCHTRSLAT